MAGNHTVGSALQPQQAGEAKIVCYMYSCLVKKQTDIDVLLFPCSLNNYDSRV